MLESSKVRFLNDPPKLYRWYITLLCINLLLYLLLLSSTMGDNTILSFMSTFPVAIYMDPLKQKRDIFKQNNKKFGIYR
jgi:hypothetical protein